MNRTSAVPTETLDPAKFRDPEVTADGSRRARVAPRALATLWFNTGTVCNLTCHNCYIESSPTNDSLQWLTAAEVASFLDEMEGHGDGPGEIGFTGGEPFMNPDIMAMLEDALSRGHRVLVLTNAMLPMLHLKEALLAARRRHPGRLAVRVSVDHHGPALHELERGPGTWARTIEGLVWLSENGFDLRVAGRTGQGEPEERLRDGYRALFARLGIAIDAGDPEALVLFPEMDADLDVAEITEACWGLLGVDPDDMMCATSRMVVRRRGDPGPVVMPCTLLSHDDGFVMGTTLGEALRDVPLNHPHCARFCVLGGGSCSRAD